MLFNSKYGICYIAPPGGGYEPPSGGETGGSGGLPSPPSGSRGGSGGGTQPSTPGTSPGQGPTQGASQSNRYSTSNVTMPMNRRGAFVNRNVSFIGGASKRRQIKFDPSLRLSDIIDTLSGGYFK